MDKAVQGIWTPWADVICYECHGPDFSSAPNGRKLDKESEEWKKLTKPEYAPAESITHCDKCNKLVSVVEEIAAEHNFVSSIKSLGYEASMAQTGGMNSAGIIPLKDDKFIMVNFGLEADISYTLGMFKDTEDDWEYIGPVIETSYVKEAIKAVEAIKKEEVPVNER